MPAAISLITLGVADLARARAFHEALGWEGARQPDDDVVFFASAGSHLALWRREAMGAETGIPDAHGTGGVALARNVGSPEEVDALLARAQAAGGTVVQPGERTSWGGYSGMFTDPDGHAWEVAHNPFWELRDDGTVRIV